MSLFFLFFFLGGWGGFVFWAQYFVGSYNGFSRLIKERGQILKMITLVCLDLLGI